MQNITSTISKAWKELFADFSVHIQSLNYAVNRGGMYQSYAMEFVVWANENNCTSIVNLQSNDVFRYIDHIRLRPRKRGTGALSEGTVTHHIFALKLLFDFAYQTEIINHTIPIPKVRLHKGQVTDIVTMEEMTQVFNACENPRDTAMITILYGCGLRRMEAFWLDTTDVQLHNRIVYVQEGKGRKSRKVPLSNKSIQHLMEYEREYRPLLLKKRWTDSFEPAYLLNNDGYRLKGDGMNKRLKYLVQNTGNIILQRKKISLHSLRHSIATHLTQQNVDMAWIQSFLGHATSDSTHIYTRHKKNFARLY